MRFSMATCSPWIGHGLGAAMPPFGAVLDEQARWALIDFIHANADAARLRSADGRVTTNGYPMPRFSAECPDGSIITTDRLMGQAVHILFADGDGSMALPQIADDPRAVLPILVAAYPGKLARGCVARAPDALRLGRFYARQTDKVPTTSEWLVDAQGLLRALWSPGHGEPWTSLAVLQRRVRESFASRHSHSRPGRLRASSLSWGLHGVDQPPACIMQRRCLRSCCRGARPDKQRSCSFNRRSAEQAKVERRNSSRFRPARRTADYSTRWMFHDVAFSTLGVCFCRNREAPQLRYCCHRFPVDRQPLPRRYDGPGNQRQFGAGSPAPSEGRGDNENAEPVAGIGADCFCADARAARLSSPASSPWFRRSRPAARPTRPRA